MKASENLLFNEEEEGEEAQEEDEATPEVEADETDQMDVDPPAQPPLTGGFWWCARDHVVLQCRGVAGRGRARVEGPRRPLSRLLPVVLRRTHHATNEEVSQPDPS